MILCKPNLVSSEKLTPVTYVCQFSTKRNGKLTKYPAMYELCQTCYLHCHLWHRLLKALPTYTERDRNGQHLFNAKRSKPSFLRVWIDQRDVQQCDQMAKLFVQFLAFYKKEHLLHISPEQVQNLPNTK